MATSYGESNWVNIHCVGADEIKTVLDKVPAGVFVIWLTGYENSENSRLAYPPQEMLDEIRDYAIQQGLDFYAPEQ